MLEQAAELAGLSLGSYVRQRVLTAPKTRAVRRPPIEQKLLAQLLGQLGVYGFFMSLVHRPPTPG